MSYLIYVYTQIIYRPLLNSLVFIYAYLPYHDLGLAIFGLTFVVRLILHPTVVQTLRSQKAMTRIQPRLKEIQERFKNDKETQARETMALYKSEGVHPLSGCLPVIIQIPLLIGLYQVFSAGVKSFDASLLYSFVPAIGSFNTVAFGLFDLAARSPLLALLAGATQFLQARFMTPVPAVNKNKKGAADFAGALQFQTKYFLPVFIAFISWSLPSAVAFYWTVLNLLAIVQQLWIQKRLEGKDYEPGGRLPKTNFG